jgi:mannose-1-phosphate guanylyltransferase
LYEHKAPVANGESSNGNVTEASDLLSIEASGNYVYSPDKFVAIVGVDNLVVVDTGDALLITSRDKSQDVGRVVKELMALKKTHLI